MPTAAKLVGAIAFAAIGYALFLQIAVIIGDGPLPGYLMILSVGAGILVGWVTCGRNAVDLRSGIGHGYTAIVGLALFVLFGLSFGMMITRALRRRYDGPVEAIIDMLALVSHNIMRFATLEIALLIIVGGFVGGAAAGLAGKLFPR